ncbi:hypothetical protein BC477_07890 [Clavibacter michiganensis subsp. michiganensis]|uniref:Uncharacterized protein n=1 Tax=Clavibacter michiganensis subsp. michiganensis TaxID=33013 RepID=A0A251XMI0_CLAMM|nr:hypothetical protein BC477_07890 [Clavibacter michiganensis subsp. michiganensis]OUE04641.1 hypothetical protein CMMCAS07_06820 [Clavibacter michiganensis subsp. michiganensis]
MSGTARVARYAMSQMRGPGEAMSMSITPVRRPSAKTRLCGAKSLWQITSAGTLTSDCQTEPPSMKPTLASWSSRRRRPAWTSTSSAQIQRGSG